MDRAQCLVKVCKNACAMFWYKRGSNLHFMVNCDAGTGELYPRICEPSGSCYKSANLYYKTTNMQNKTKSDTIMF